MPIIAANGAHFRVEIDGPADAPPLMLSNSLSSNLSMWDAQIPALTRLRRVIRYDSRGHGASDAPARPYSIAELGRDALALMDALGVSKVDWCGLSKGGMVGMWLLTNAPDRLGKVILANTAARMGPPDLWNARIAATRAGGMEAVADANLGRWFTKPFRDAHVAEMARIRAMIVSTPVAGYGGCCAAIRDMDQREALRRATRPTLVIVGAQDPATTPEAGALIAERIPGARLATLDAAHLSNVEAAEAFNREASAFLAD